MPRKACKTGTSRIHKTGQKSTSIINRWVLIILWRFCEALILRASQGFFTCFRTQFSWFDTISFDFGVTLILFTPNYTIDLHLHHSRYSFRQIHFWHLIFCMSHFSDMIVDILSDLRIRMVFAPLRSVLVCIDKDKLCKQATLHQSKYRCRTNKATAYHYCFFELITFFFVIISSP